MNNNTVTGGLFNTANANLGNNPANTSVNYNFNTTNNANKPVVGGFGGFSFPNTANNSAISNSTTGGSNPGATFGQPGAGTGNTAGTLFGAPKTGTGGFLNNTNNVSNNITGGGAATFANTSATSSNSSSSSNIPGFGFKLPLSTTPSTNIGFSPGGFTAGSVTNTGGSISSSSNTSLSASDVARLSVIGRYLLQIDNAYNAAHPQCKFRAFVYNISPKNLSLPSSSPPSSLSLSSLIQSMQQQQAPQTQQKPLGGFNFNSNNLGNVSSGGGAANVNLVNLLNSCPDPSLKQMYLMQLLSNPGSLTSANARVGSLNGAGGGGIFGGGPMNANISSNDSMASYCFTDFSTPSLLFSLLEQQWLKAKANNPMPHRLTPYAVHFNEGLLNRVKQQQKAVELCHKGVDKVEQKLLKLLSILKKNEEKIKNDLLTNQKAIERNILAVMVQQQLSRLININGVGNDSNNGTGSGSSSNNNLGGVSDGANPPSSLLLPNVSANVSLPLDPLDYAVRDRAELLLKELTQTPGRYYTAYSEIKPLIDVRTRSTIAAYCNAGGGDGSAVLNGENCASGTLSGGVISSSTGTGGTNSNLLLPFNSPSSSSALIPASGEVNGDGGSTTNVIEALSNWAAFLNKMDNGIRNLFMFVNYKLSEVDLIKSDWNQRISTVI